MSWLDEYGSTLNPTLLTRLQAAQDAYGRPLVVTSGRQGRPGTPGSMHPHGMAADLSMAGMDNAERLRMAQIVRDAGILRFGTYDDSPDMLHVDMSDAQGGNWYMHNKTNRQIASAPEWMQTFADVRQAANTAGSTDPKIPSGDPVTGRMIPQRAQTMLPQFPTLPPTAPAEGNLMNPIIALIAGLAGGGGIRQGLGSAGAAVRHMDLAENELLDLKQKRADAQRKRQGQDSIDMFGQQLEQHPDPQMRQAGAMIRMNPEAGFRIYSEIQKSQAEAAQREAHAQQLKAAGATDYQIAQAMAGQNPGQQVQPPGPAEYGLAATTFMAPDGKTVMERVRAKDGTYIDRVLPGAPLAYDPETAAEVAAHRAAGTFSGKDRAEREKSVSLFGSIAPRIEMLIDKLPDGLASNLAGQAASTVGWDTESTTALKALIPLVAGLVNTVEKQPGPASDLDVALYRDTVGNLTDPKHTRASRRAAWEEVKIQSENLKNKGHPAFADWPSAPAPAQDPGAAPATVPKAGPGSGDDPLGWRK